MKELDIVDREALEDMFPEWDMDARAMTYVEPSAVSSECVCPCDPCCCQVYLDMRGTSDEMRAAKAWLENIIAFEDAFPQRLAMIGGVSPNDEQIIGQMARELEFAPAPTKTPRDRLVDMGWKVSTTAELERKRADPFRDQRMERNARIGRMMEAEDMAERHGDERADLAARPLTDSRALAAHAQSTAAKVAHVRKATQTRGHGCHWPGCDAQCPPAQWGCSAHWFRLPKYLRDRIWKAYRAGQEETLTPSREYLDVAHEVQAWILKYGGAP